MKQAVLQRPRSFKVEEVPDPKAGPDDIIIRVKAIGLCGSELPLFEAGLPPERVKEDGLETVSMQMLGHEWSGEVVEVGANVTNAKVGERCLQGGYGGFLEYYVTQRMPMRIPDDMSYEVGATIEPSGVAMKAVMKSDPQPGETVAVIGAGLIGQVAAQIYKELGASKVIVSELTQKRVETARAIGAADLVINATDQDPVKEILEATDGEGVDIAATFTDSPDAWHDSFEVVRGGALWHRLRMNKPVTKHDGGKVVMVAGSASPEWWSPILWRKELTVRGSWGGRGREALDMVKAGKINTKDLITHEFALDDITEAYEMQLKRNESVKVLVKP